MTENRPRRWVRPILWLRRMVRLHEDASVRLVLATHVVLNVLDIINRAEYQSIEPNQWITPIVESPIWVIVSVLTVIWMLVHQHPPKVIWGLWVSTGMFATWGLLNLVVGITASHPVSLVGPSLMFFVLAPLAWLAADAMSERIARTADDPVDPPPEG